MIGAAQPMVMPKLGLTMTEGTLAEWKVAPAAAPAEPAAPVPADTRGTLRPLGGYQRVAARRLTEADVVWTDEGVVELARVVFAWRWRGRRA